MYVLLFDPLSLTGAVIITDDRLGSAADTDHGRCYQQHIALYNGSAGDQHISLFRSSVFLKNRVHDNQKNAVCCQNQKRGHSKVKDIQHQFSAVIAKGNAHVDFFC